MTPPTGKQSVLWNALAVAVGLVPLALFWFVFQRVPTVDVADATKWLSQTNEPAVLVDVRSETVFASNHAPGAVSFPRAKIDTLASVEDLPASLRNKRLLLICDTGLGSALAVRRLRAVNGVGAFNVAGGMQAWFAQGDGKKSGLPFRPMTRLEQWLTVIIAFVIKPIYMLISLGIIVWLWRQRAADLAALRWGLIWFWIGENGCSIDFLFFARGSDFWEYVHGYGMAVGFAFVVYAVLEGLDYRLIKFSPEKERCAALSLCRACLKYAPAPCGLKRLFTVMIPAFMLLSLMPWCASLSLTSYDTNILGTVHNYCHMVSAQLFEYRFCAGLALLLFTVSWLVLLFKRHQPVAVSKVLFAAALGPLSFGMLRMFFVSTFTDNLMWFDVWEELTELLFIVSIGLVLWVFRDALFLKKPVEAPRALPSAA
jgi:rhodanese-related sulfurtransferase